MTRHLAKLSIGKLLLAVLELVKVDVIVFEVIVEMDMVDSVITQRPLLGSDSTNVIVHAGMAR